MISCAAREIAHLSALSLWRGLVGFYQSENLTHAASIAYYALLSLFPFSMLALAILGSVTGRRNGCDRVQRLHLRVIGVVVEIFGFDNRCGLGEFSGRVAARLPRFRGR